MSVTYDLVCILGPTASGKTSVAVNLASQIDGEIISADSRQVYRGMDIGTGKELEEYSFRGKTIPFHLIDIADPGYKYNVFEYQRDFFEAYNSVVKRRKIPVLCGGTGLYIEAVTKGYRLLEVPANPDLREQLKNKSLEELIVLLASYKPMHNTTDTDHKKRVIRAIEIEQYCKDHASQGNTFPPLKTLYIGLSCDRSIRRERITRRLKSRLQQGLVNEVRSLLAAGTAAEDLIYYGLEYKYVTQFVTGEITEDKMFVKLETAIHQFAKRQMTWFRGMERKGTKIHWLDSELPVEEKISFITALL